MSLKYVLLLLHGVGSCLHAQQFYSWAVVGAGPAGVTSVAQLLEHGVKEREIVWIDPEFSSGRMGKYYRNVPSNQKAYQFMEFLNQSSIFRAFDSSAVQAMRAHNQQEEYPLKLAVNILTDLTQHLCNRVFWQQDKVNAMWSSEGLWWLKLNNKTICARKVILAIGAHPKAFCYEGIQEIPLDIALDEQKLQKLVTHDDTVMVVGSAHSAFLIVKYLYDFGVKKIISVYSKEPTFGMIGGLAGITAYWVQNVLFGTQPENIIRVKFDPHIVQEYISSCTKIVYAFGYEPNEILVNGSTRLSYDSKTGVIQKNLYGIGIAFPQPYITDDGRSVNLIGFNSFIYRAKTCMPAWLEESSDFTNEMTSIEQQVRENTRERQQLAPSFDIVVSECESRWI